MSLLKINNLKIQFPTKHGLIKAVDGIDFEIDQNEILGLVGESGSGKSVTALSLLKLTEKPGKITEGEIFWKGKNILEFNEEGLRKIRGNEISMIFQDPYGSLNPVYPIGKQISEVLELHQGMTNEEAIKRTIELLELVKIPQSKLRVNDYPHQFSGGMCQRVMIAMAIACRPDLLIADEPTTALDVTIQSEIMQLLLALKKETNMAILLISHDLHLISSVCDRVAVMYQGKIVETGSASQIYSSPKEAYTKRLLKAFEWKKG